jgi:restriction system protein
MHNLPIGFRGAIMENNIFLVRSAQKLIEQDLIGYGWEKVNFTKYSDAKELIEHGFDGIDFGRKRKQIERYYNIKKGDIIIVPVQRAIAIGIATGEKLYETNAEINYSANRIKVNFLKKDSKVIYISRSNLETRFQQRLKIRTSIANFNDFRDEVETIIKSINNGENYEKSTIFANKEREAKEKFIEKMLTRMQNSEDITIAAGGAGLEALIREMFESKGYDTFIPPKNKKGENNEHIADADIVAYKNGELWSKGELILIQAKHHKGETSDRGVKQLEAIEDYTFGNMEFSEDDYVVKKILITTGQKESQNHSQVQIIDGQLFVEWLYDNLALLSKKTKEQLGISEVPTLV